MRGLALTAKVAGMLALSGCVYIDANQSDDVARSEMHMDKMSAMEESEVHSEMHAPARSNASFSVTRSRLLAAISSRGLTNFIEIDHRANAARAGLDLAPNSVIIFGNPKAGTALMKADPAIGKSLPLRAHIYEQGGKVYVAMSNVDMMAHHHDLSAAQGVAQKVKATLAAIKAEAIGAN